MVQMKPLVSALCFILCFPPAYPTEYSCDVFRKDFYTAEYGEKCYTDPEGREVWKGAKDWCESYGGHLPRLKNNDQYEFVLNPTNYMFRGQNHEKNHMLLWNDARQINGTLYWTNGELVTFSKRLYKGDENRSVKCIVLSLRGWQLVGCDPDYYSDFVCEHDKLPKTYETTAGLTVLAESTTTVTVQRDKAKVQRQMKFRDIRHLNGIMNPRLNMNAEGNIFTKSLTDCAERCFDLMQGCQLFNFNIKSGECRIYLKTNAPLQSGAENVVGWKIYQRY